MYSPFCTFISYKKNSRARALTKDMGRARKKKYSCANFELKQERTAAMFLSENTNPSNICFFYRDVSKTFWETLHLWLGECSIKFYFFWELEIVWGVFDTIDDFASITNLSLLIAEYLSVTWIFFFLNKAEVWQPSLNYSTPFTNLIAAPLLHLKPLCFSWDKKKFHDVSYVGQC